MSSVINQKIVINSQIQNFSPKVCYVQYAGPVRAVSSVSQLAFGS